MVEVKTHVSCFGAVFCCVVDYRPVRRFEVQLFGRGSSAGIPFNIFLCSEFLRVGIWCLYLILGCDADKYGLPRPELIRSDNAIYGRHFRVMELYDCIVCDPPYGIRCVRFNFSNLPLCHRNLYENLSVGDGGRCIVGQLTYTKTCGDMLIHCIFFCGQSSVIHLSRPI